MHTQTRPPGLGAVRVILIGGASHTGKSTLAQALATRLGWNYLSTDKLARHPGRPWRSAPSAAPEHVAGHYASLSVEGLTADVLQHYQDTVWPLIESLVSQQTHNSAAGGLVLEGSAILPELAATLHSEPIGGLWLVATKDVLEQRIALTSEYDTRPSAEKFLIDQFRRRTWAFQEHLVQQTLRHGLRTLDAGSSRSLDDLATIALIRIGNTVSNARSAEM